MQSVDLAATPLRDLNAALQAQAAHTNQTAWEVLNPRGAHAIAMGLDGYFEPAPRQITPRVGK